MLIAKSLLVEELPDIKSYTILVLVSQIEVAGCYIMIPDGCEGFYSEGMRALD